MWCIFFGLLGFVLGFVVAIFVIMITMAFGFVHIDYAKAPRFLIAEGSFGTVTGHCDDGRAVVEFDTDRSVHTFHFPDGFIQNA